MIFLHINPTTKNTKKFNKYVSEGKHIFVLFYLEGCGPCNATRPEWKKIKNVLNMKYKHNNNVVIADVDQALMREIKYLTNEPKGFPSMVYISGKGTINENYEDCNINRKDRTVDSFIEWIESKVKMQKMRQMHQMHQNYRHNKTQKGGKWSLKYKRSIDCKHPKGFSQKQHCKYGRKKTQKTQKRV
jgi:thiol-disulfide isomerase/thioredoxin